MRWIFLALAIGCEVAATMALRASDGLRRKSWAPAIIAGYVASFAFLNISLRRGMAIGVAYGIWSAVGIALIAIIARVVFKEPLTRTMGLGIVIIGVGVLLVEIGSQTSG